MYKIGSGAHHTAVISNDNLLYVWGSCKQGQLPKPTSPPKRGEQDNVQQHTIVNTVLLHDFLYRESLCM